VFGSLMGQAVAGWGSSVAKKGGAAEGEGNKRKRRYDLTAGEKKLIGERYQELKGQCSTKSDVTRVLNQIAHEVFGSYSEVTIEDGDQGFRLGFGVEGLGFGVWGSGSRVLGFGFRV